MKNGKQMSAVIFDVDGTLVDSNSLHVEAWREAFSHFGKDLDFEEVHRQIGKGGDQLMPEFLTEDELEQYGEKLDKFRGDLFLDKYLDRVTPFPRVRELFDRLRAEGFKIALASSAKDKEVEQHMETLDIADLVDFATSADDVDESKPSPDIFQAALAGLKDISPEEAVIVGDSPWDAVAAGKAGMKMIGLLSGGFSEDALRSKGALEIYADIADLLERYDQSLLAKARVLEAGR